MTMTTTPKKSTTRVCEREKASERERKLSLAVVVDVVVDVVVVDVVVVVIIEKLSGENKLRMRQKVFSFSRASESRGRLSSIKRGRIGLWRGERPLEEEAGELIMHSVSLTVSEIIGYSECFEAEMCAC